jgi:hypothetical protein
MDTFTLSASSGQLRSVTMSLIVSTPGEQPSIDLVLSASDAQSVSAPGDAGEAMQFADKPDFA